MRPPRPRHAPILPALILLALALPGCSIIDQTTFYGETPKPAAPAPKPPPPPVSAETRTPLVVIKFDVPNLAYQDPLRAAVREARQRIPSVAFDVVSVVPAQGSIDAQAAAAEAARPEAEDVGRTIISAGIPAARVHLGVRAEPGVTVRDVRVFVR